MKYDFRKIEKKWQNFWSKNKTFEAKNSSNKPKYYILDMFPYPSGSGLHVGHPLGYIASDIISRFMRHKGFNVLHPQGYDSFGLPAEQYAIETGQHPEATTDKNIKRYRKQLDRMGFSFDWDREIKTSNPDYYRWTQWIFLELYNSFFSKESNRALPISDLISNFSKFGNQNIKAFSDSDISHFSAEEWNKMDWIEKEKILMKYRLTYLAESQVNWCPELGTVLANDEVINGVSERGGFPVIKKKMKQWSMRISAYSDRLLEGLDKIDWPEPLKEMQRNWIGKSEGVVIKFKVYNKNQQIEAFTTRPDTIFGVTFMTLAPEHEIISKIVSTEQKVEVNKYIKQVINKSDLERQSDIKNITGVFSGSYVIHPFTGNKIPIWIGEYVLSGYGTGAVMGVPCGDQRDYDFAKFFRIPIVNIFDDIDISESAYVEKSNVKITKSDFLNGLSFENAFVRTIDELEKRGSGYSSINYKLRDAIFSRQRYWGEPIPVYFMKDTPVPIPYDKLPLKLPDVKKYLPTKDGSPPLGNSKNWAWDIEKEEVVLNEKIDNKKVFPLELNTMPGWAGSSWYFNRYMDPNNTNSFVGNKAVNYWKNVDLYLGGSEHATGHLLYSRFWQNFLFDRGYLPVKEYAKKLINQGMILGNSAFIFRDKKTKEFLSKNLVEVDKVEPIRVDISLVNERNELDIAGLKKNNPVFNNSKFILENGKYIVGREVEKMSKSKHNIVNPDEICEKYGADTLRMYEMFLGPIDQDKPWNTEGITGVYNFLNKLWKLFYNGTEFLVKDEYPSEESLRVLHKSIKKITEDIERFSFNTCISTFMICVNELTVLKCQSRNILEPLIILLSPFAPHISEEIWSILGNKESIEYIPYPKFDNQFIKEFKKNYPVSFNGKTRYTLELSLDLSKNKIEEIVLNEPRTEKYLKGETPKKIIFIKGKIINIVT